MRYFVVIFVVVTMIGCTSLPESVLQLRQYERGLQTQALSKDEMADRLLDSANVFSSSGDFELAVLYAERAKSFSPENPYIWFQLARFFAQQQRYKEAESSALRTIRFSEDNLLLRAKGWRLIENVRLISGNELDSHYAASRADELEKEQIRLYN